MKFWKWIFIILGLDFLLGGSILDGTKGGPGCGCLGIFTIIFFPIWLIFRLIRGIFRAIF